MRFHDVVLTAIECRQLTGTGKNGKAYNFPILEVGDEDLNKFSVGVNRNDLDEGTKLPQWLIDACENKEKFSTSMNIRPDRNDQYGKACTIELYDLKNEI